MDDNIFVKEQARSLFHDSPLKKPHLSMRDVNAPGEFDIDQKDA